MSSDAIVIPLQERARPPGAMSGHAGRRHRLGRLGRNPRSRRLVDALPRLAPRRADLRTHRTRVGTRSPARVCRQLSRRTADAAHAIRNV